MCVESISKVKKTKKKYSSRGRIFRESSFFLRKSSSSTFVDTPKTKTTEVRRTMSQVKFNTFVASAGNNVDGPPSEEALRDQEANILQLGERFREEGRRSEMTDLIQKVRVVLKYMSKAKAAKLVRGLVDMFLEMKSTTQDDNGELGVQVCKVRPNSLLLAQGFF